MNLDTQLSRKLQLPGNINDISTLFTIWADKNVKYLTLLLYAGSVHFHLPFMFNKRMYCEIWKLIVQFSIPPTWWHFYVPNKFRQSAECSKTCFRRLLNMQTPVLTDCFGNFSSTCIHQCSITYMYLQWDMNDQFVWFWGSLPGKVLLSKAKSSQSCLASDNKKHIIIKLVWGGREISFIIRLTVNHGFCTLLQKKSTAAKLSYDVTSSLDIQTKVHHFYVVPAFTSSPHWCTHISMNKKLRIANVRDNTLLFGGPQWGISVSAILRYCDAMRVFVSVAGHIASQLPFMRA